MDNFNEGWNVMEKGIRKLKALLAGDPESPFTSEEYMVLYTTIYELCNENQDHSLRMYTKYRLTFEDYLSSMVLPSLQDKHDEFLLRDLATRWSNHKRMVYWMFRFFHYLERYYIKQMRLPGLNEVASICFRDLVYTNVKEKICDAALLLIDQEREGQEVDRALLKNVIDIFIEIGMGKMQYYANDFEAPMLEHTSAYYSQKASMSILQVDECLKVEKDRVSHYLHFSSQPKLIERVQREFLVVCSAQPRLLDQEEPGI